MKAVYKIYIYIILYGMECSNHVRFLFGWNVVKVWEECNKHMKFSVLQCGIKRGGRVLTDLLTLASSLADIFIVHLVFVFLFSQ